MILSLGFIAFVTVLHIVGKVHPYLPYALVRLVSTSQSLLLSCTLMKLMCCSCEEIRGMTKKLNQISKVKLVF